MSVISVSESFYIRFGTANPIWKFQSDSNVLHLSDSVHGVHTSIQIEPEQARAVRSLGEEITSLRCAVQLFGEPMDFFLIGKRLTDWAWGGVASDISDVAVATDDIMTQLTKSPPRNVIYLSSRRSAGY